MMNDDLREEYTLEDFPNGLERGRYADRVKEGSNIVRLDPDVAEAFPDSQSVNDALRSLLRIAASLKSGPESPKTIS